MQTATVEINNKLNAPAEEAYRVLRTNIQFCGYDQKIKLLSLTSCNPNEGKTTTSINLGISMAQSGMQVLYVDADLRKPAALKHLGAKNGKGLSNLLAGKAALDEVTNKTNVEGFHFISCGPKPPNPAELVSSKAFCSFLEQVKEMYDLVIVDTPPLGSVIDCAVISSKTDATLLVIQAKAVSYKQVQRVKDQLEKANTRLIGVVLTKVVKSDYKNYYNYYNYYSHTKEKKSWWHRLIQR